jgi:hypothetical protein
MANTSRIVAIALASFAASCSYQAPTLHTPVVVTPEKAAGVLVLVQCGDGKAALDEYQVNVKNAVEAQLRRAGFRITHRYADTWALKAFLQARASYAVDFLLETRDRALDRLSMSNGNGVPPEQAARAIRQRVERSEALATFIEESGATGFGAAAAPAPPRAWIAPAKVTGTQRRLAVLEFRGALSPPLLALLADQARAAAVEAVRAHGIAVMTRENMVVMLKDQGRTATCTEGECEVESARSIGADLVVTGEVSKVGSALFLVTKLFDSTSGSLVASKHVKAADDVALVDAAKPAAAALFE